MTGTWEQHYAEAKAYYEQNGHLEVSCHSSLYVWLSEQRYARRGKRGTLTGEQIALLDNLGMRWESRRDVTWQWYYAHARTYYEVHGSLNIPVSYVTEDGCSLGRWLVRQRKAYRELLCYPSREKKHQMLLRREEIDLLEAIGMQWDVTGLGKHTSVPEMLIYHYVHVYFPDARKLSRGDFLGMEIDIYIPSIKTGIEYNGVAWHKSKSSLEEEKNAKCLEHGIQLFRIREQGLDPVRNCAYQLFVKPGNLQDLGQAIETVLLKLTGKRCCCNIEKEYEKIVSEKQAYSSYAWDQVYETLLIMYETEGAVNIREGMYDASGRNLYYWMAKQRKDYQRGHMPQRHIKKLQQIGVVLDPQNDAWEKYYERAVTYVHETGALDVPAWYETADGAALGKWISHQREAYRMGKLGEQWSVKLEQLGMQWNPMEASEQRKRETLMRYYGEFGHIQMPMHTEYEGVHLWEWLQGKKKKWVQGQLPEEEQIFLEQYGIVWQSFPEKWAQAYEKAKQYYEEKGTLFIPKYNISKEEQSLKNWLYRQRSKYRRNQLTKEQIQQLERIGMWWGQSKGD